VNTGLGGHQVIDANDHSLHSQNDFGMNDHGNHKL